MEQLYLKVLGRYPEILIKPTIKEIISYGNINLIYPLLWIYKYYFDYKLIVYLPKYKNINLDFGPFNMFIEDPAFFIKDISLICSDLETLENFKCEKNTFTIFAYFDYIYLEISNKKRLNTILKKIKSKSKIHILSYCSLDYTNINSLDSFTSFGNFNFNFSFIDILDSDPEIYESNKESLIDLIKDNGKVYLSLNIPLEPLKEIERMIKENNIIITRKENELSDVVINSSKTTEKIFLKNKYKVFIFILPQFEEPLEILNFIKEIPEGSEIYIDASNEEIVTKFLKKIKTKNINFTIKDSLVFDVMPSNGLMASESYFKFKLPESYLMDFSNLNKKDYDLVKNFIKIKLNGILDFDIKTCSICSPSSPRDYSNKLNKLSNKIKYPTFRSDTTCEIYKENGIIYVGIVLWNEMFKLNEFVMEKQTFIYQTTRGKWRTTTIS